MKSKGNEKKVVNKAKKSSLIKDAWKRLMRNRLAVLGMIILAILVLVAIFAPLIAPYNPTKINFGDEGVPPTWWGAEETGQKQVDSKDEQSNTQLDQEAASEGSWTSGETEQGSSENQSDSNSGWSSGSESAVEESESGESSSGGWTSS